MSTKPVHLYWAGTQTVTRSRPVQHYQPLVNVRFSGLHNDGSFDPEVAVDDGEGPVREGSTFVSKKTSPPFSSADPIIFDAGDPDTEVFISPLGAGGSKHIYQVQDKGGVLADLADLTAATDPLVTGPASATNNALSRFDGTTGKLIQNSGAILDDDDDLSGLRDLTLSRFLNTRDPDLFTVGPALGSTDNAIARYDGTGGVTLQDSSATIDDSGKINIGAIPESVARWVQIVIDKDDAGWDLPWAIPIAFNTYTLDAASGLFTPPFYIHAARLKHDVAWDGGTLTGCNMTLQVNTVVSIALDVFAAPTAARLLTLDYGHYQSGGSSPKIQVNTVGGNIDQLDEDGDADVWLLISKE